MKKFVILVSVLCLALTSWAGSVDNVSQHSADYIRKLSKNGSVDGVDIISYNPAGVQQMKDGFYLQLNNQTILKDYEMEIENYPLSSHEKFGSDAPTYIVPSFYALYKQDDWSAFGSFTIPAGGGALEYNDGVHILPKLETGYQQYVQGQMQNPNYGNFAAIMSDGRFEGSTIYAGVTVGGGYSITDQFSVSLAGRYINANRTYDGDATFNVMGVNADGTPHLEQDVERVLDAERDADGFGFILGMNYKASEKLNFGMRVESATKLEFETEINEMSPEWSALTGSAPLDIFKDGAKIRRDLPWVAGFGVEYKLNPELLLSTGINYYFLEDCEGLDESYENGYELQFALDYKLLNNLHTSFGYNFVKVGGTEESYYDFEYQLDSHFFGTGCKYLLNDKMDIAFGMGKVFYLSEESERNNYQGVEYKKDIWLFSVGFEYKLF